MSSPIPVMRRVLVGYCPECRLIYEPWAKGQSCDGDEHYTRNGQFVFRRGLRKVWLWECSNCAVHDPEHSWFLTKEEHERWHEDEYDEPV